MTRRGQNADRRTARGLETTMFASRLVGCSGGIHIETWISVKSTGLAREILIGPRLTGRLVGLGETLDHITEICSETIGLTCQRLICSRRAWNRFTVAHHRSIIPRFNRDAICFVGRGRVGIVGSTWAWNRSGIPRTVCIPPFPRIDA